MNSTKVILKDLQAKCALKKRSLAVLLDPEKVDLLKLPSLVDAIHKAPISHIFVGGSTDEKKEISSLIKHLKSCTKLPVLLFPGGANQVVAEADGILFLSLLSGRNPSYLIDHHIQAVPTLMKSSLEIIPTGYILIDGGNETAVQRISQTQPIPQDQVSTIIHTALAGQYMGKELIYLEAGSGAEYPVVPKLISAVKKQLNIPLIVGGGITNKTQLDQAYEAGADLVVIGTAFENNPQFFTQIDL